MKKVILFILIGAVLGGGLVWLEMRKSPGAPDEKTSEKKPDGDEGTKVTHDTNGNTVVVMPDEIRGEAGIEVANPVATNFSLEMKVHGQVIDPTALAGLVSDWINAHAAGDYSSKELARMKTLLAQKNTSERAYAEAESAARKDAATEESLRLKSLTAWGEKLTGRIANYVATNEEGRKADSFISGLLELKTLLVRVDVPPGGKIKSPEDILSARLESLGNSQDAVEAQMFDAAAAVDPQTQMRSFYLTVARQGSLQPGAAVTAYLKLAGEPVAGVILPRDSIVRAEGRGWVYVQDAGGESYTRTAILLDHSTDEGWFASGPMTASSYIVVKGAQTLLSEELKASLGGG